MTATTSLSPSFGFLEEQMKIISIIKAILSGFVWGFGQLLNFQFLKAIFFFIVFVGFVGIELSTSNYFVETDAYDKLPGEDFGDDWYQMAFIPDYLFNNQPYEPFEAFAESVGGYENITEDMFLSFLAKDLKDNNPSTYTTLSTSPQVFLAEDMTDVQFTRLIRRGTLFKDEQGTLYVERNITNLDGSVKKEYVESTILTGVLNENNILESTEGLTTFVKQNQLVRVQNTYYLVVNDAGSTKYINLITEEIVNSLSSTDEVSVTGPIFRADGIVYEYFQAGLMYNSVRMQYRETMFTRTFRQSMFYTYSQPWNRYNNSDYTRLLLKLHFELNPDIKDSFREDYNNFFYDQAGFFLRSYWSVITLGTTFKLNFTGHMALQQAVVGRIGGEFSLYSTPNFNVSEIVPFQGHISTIILLEGLIGVILSFFFFIFMYWSISDAYKTAELKRLKKPHLGDRDYFKNVYEESFEYIVLSPALFVLAFISIMPIVFGFVISFTDISGNESMLDTFNWVGLTNFIALFNFETGLGASFGRAFWRVLSWTIVWAIFSTFTVFFGGFIQALILNSEKVVFRKLWRTVLILPWAMPALLSQMVFSVMFNEFGFINTFLTDIGLYKILLDLGMLGVPFSELTGISRLFYLGQDNIQWFTNPFNPTFVRTTLVVVNIWLGFPYFMALMTGVMTAIDRTLYEAADIDGATHFQKIKSITMPLVLYSTAPILIMTFSGNFNNFGVIYFITGGGPNAGHYSRGFAGDTDILISWMYKLTVDEAIFNMASVFSVLIFLFVGSITAWNLSKTRAFQED
jgi:arabinogalactan oligomer / maltooligosaccharide transport system permease protein